MLMHEVRDGYITGGISSVKGNCALCGRGTTIIIVTKVELPDDILLKSTIMYTPNTGSTSEATKHKSNVGIGCGCYAKFHRQVAHILGNIRARERALGRKA